MGEYGVWTSSSIVTFAYDENIYISNYAVAESAEIGIHPLANIRW